MTGSHWHRCRLALRPGHLLVAAEQYVADGRHPAGQSLVALPAHLPDDPTRASALADIVETSWRTTPDPPFDVVATHDVVTVTAGAQVLVLRSDGLAACGRVRRFRGRLAWVAPSPLDDSGVVLVRVDLARTSRPPRHRSLVFTLDTGTRAAEIPEPGAHVVGSHYANGHVTLVGPGGAEAAWLGGRLLDTPEVLPLRRHPGTGRQRPERPE